MKHITAIQDDIAHWYTSHYTLVDKYGYFVIAEVGRIAEEGIKFVHEIGKYRTDNPKVAKEMYRRAQLTHIMRAAVFLLCYAQRKKTFVSIEEAQQHVHQYRDSVTRPEVLGHLVSVVGTFCLTFPEGEDCRTYIQRAFNHLALLAVFEEVESPTVEIRNWLKYV